MFCGRTLFGAKPPKGQELEDHYFGTIKPRIKAFMDDLDEELWKLGVLAKTEHNEVAPGQYELAPIFSTTNVAADHNQLTMELMKKVAGRHGLVCLLHEKPFAGVNGSGKHNNWSLSTDTGVNLLEPGASPSENAQFLTYLTAIIKAIDEYQDLLRVSVATAGNDHRLGANEAPPAIVSIFLGEELGGIIDAIVSGKAYGKKEAKQMQIGVDVLPRFPKDTTDRNRTSPFAFTGNKFEFRMLGSNLSISGPNFVLNTIVAEVLEEFAGKLEKSKNFTADLNALIKETLSAHKRIIFNGNGYEDAWVKEAEKRGLSNLKTVPDALPAFISPKSINLFVKHGVLTEVEIRSRYEIVLENYCKTLNIEVLTMLDMISKDILPAVYKYLRDLSATTIAVQSVAKGAACKGETELITKLSALADDLLAKSQKLEKASHSVHEVTEAPNAAKEYAQKVIPLMQETRAVADEIESLLGQEYLPFPTYSDLLFNV
jgi:glutamine synthetase